MKVWVFFYGMLTIANLVGTIGATIAVLYHLGLVVATDTELGEGFGLGSWHFLTWVTLLVLIGGVTASRYFARELLTIIRQTEEAT